MEEVDKGHPMIRMGVSGWVFLPVPAYPGCPGPKAVKWLCVCVCVCVWVCVCGSGQLSTCTHCHTHCHTHLNNSAYAGRHEDQQTGLFIKQVEEDDTRAATAPQHYTHRTIIRFNCTDMTDDTSWSPTLSLHQDCLPVSDIWDKLLLTDISNTSCCQSACRWRES